MDLTDDIARLLLRVTVSALLLVHGAEFLRGDRKIFVIFKNNGLPEWFAYSAVIGEVIAPVCAILGVYTRVAALLMAFFMFVAVALFHRGHLFMLSPTRDSYYLETQTFFFVMALAVALLGAGPFGLGIGGVWN